MDPILLGILVGLSTIIVLFSGISVAVGLLVVSAVWGLIFMKRWSAG